MARDVTFVLLFILYSAIVTIGDENICDKDGCSDEEKKTGVDTERKESNNYTIVI